MKIISQYKTDRFSLVPLYDFYENIDWGRCKFSIYKKWMLDQEVCKYNSHGLFIPTKEKLKEYIENTKDNKNILVWAILFGSDYIGHVSLQSIDWINRSSEFAVIIGEKQHWGKGITTEAMEIIFNHGFEKLNLHRIWTGTAQTNIAMNKLAIKLGMKLEGIFKEAVFLEGKYVDIYEYGMLQKNWSDGEV